MVERRIHILGGSGSGTTTLGAALAEALGCLHADTDRYFWLPGDPPFQTIRPLEERQTLLQSDLGSAPSWVLSGSIQSWGDFLIPRFTCVVWITLPAEERMRRLVERERQRSGICIEPGGDLYEKHREFLAWASDYDSGRLDMRTQARHERWIQAIPCPVIRMDGLLETAEQVRAVLDAISAG
jgi:adenylate kinase family enzyme